MNIFIRATVLSKIGQHCCGCNLFRDSNAFLTITIAVKKKDSIK